MSSPFAGAHWVWGEKPYTDLFNCYALVRKTFELPRLPERAPLFITADQSYRLWINGQFVGRGPARGFQASWPYDEWDVAPFLQVGTNVVAVRAHHPGVGTFSYISAQMAGVLVSARWPMGDAEFLLQSGEGWRAMRQSAVRKDTVPSSMQLFPQEHIDLQAEPVGWLDADFDDSGAEWNASVYGEWNSPPWHDLEPRGIPTLREEKRLPQFVAAHSSGKSADGFEAVRDVVALAVSEGLEHRSFSPAIAFNGVLDVGPTGADGYASFVLDFGRVYVGQLELEVEGAVGGEVLDGLYSEITREDDPFAPTQTPWHDPMSGCFVALGTRLVCREGRNVHAFFHPYGFRFLTLRVRNVQAPLRIVPRLNTLGYPLEVRGAFTSSDSELEQIWNACAHTQQICMLDAYMDTPWREQAQWWGDARVQAWNTFHLSDDARLLRRGIRQIGAQQTPNGLTYGHAPTVAHTCVLPDFTLIWMLTQWDHYFQTGSTEAFEENREPTRRALEYFRAQSDVATGLVKCDPRYWLFLDWTGLPKDGYSAVLNGWLVLALEKLAALHRVAGEADEARGLDEWAAKVRAGLGRLVRDGLLCDTLLPDGTVRETCSIHAQTLGLMMGLQGLDEQKIIAELLLPMMALKSLPAQEERVLPSSYWVTYVFSALSQRGYGREVVRFIRQEWEPMARFGSTWESYADRLFDGSRSHAWSAHPLFHLMQIIGGLTQTAPGWKAVRFAPTFEGRQGGASILTPKGLLRSTWEQNGQEIVVALEVPEGMEVAVELPGIRETVGSGSHEWRV